MRMSTITIFAPVLWSNHNRHLCPLTTKLKSSVACHKSSNCLYWNYSDFPCKSSSSILIKDPMNLSITIIGHNEVEHLRELLPQLKMADEIVYVDCESHDGSLETARDAGCRVFSLSERQNCGPPSITSNPSRIRIQESVVSPFPLQSMGPVTSAWKIRLRSSIPMV